MIITLGEDGVLLVGDSLEHYESTVQEVSDVTGAGDVFMAALVLGLEFQWPVSKATRVANRLAGLSVSKSGTYIITKQDWKEASEAEQ